MPAEVRRKVFQIGGRTHDRKSTAVTLPAPWVRYEGIEKGEELRVLFDRILIVLSPRTTAEVEARVRAFLDGATD